MNCNDSVSSSSSSSSSSWASSAHELSDNEEDEDNKEFYSPICNPSQSFTTLKAALDHDIQHHNFHFMDVLKLLVDDDDFYMGVKVVNLARRKQATSTNNNNIGGKELCEYLKEQVQSMMLAKLHRGTSEHEDDDEDDEDDNDLFIPVIEGDGFITHLDELLQMARQHADDDEKGISKCSKQQLLLLNNKKEQQIEHLQAQISALTAQLQDAKGVIASLSLFTANASSNDTNHEKSNSRQQRRKANVVVDNDTYYFDSYGHFGIHEIMLKDKVRTGAYEKAICGNPELFKDKIVLDVGCGTGVLSIFAARVGAKKVVGVDDSNMIHEARKIVEKNGYSDIITLVRGKVEDVELPVNNIDIIISEWMGYALFFETMLPSVMSARDRFSGPCQMFPSHCRIYLEGGSDNRLNYWDDVHGIDMSSIKQSIYRELTSEAQVECFSSNKVVTDRYELIGYDLNNCRSEDLDFAVPFKLIVPSTTKVDVLVVSFDIDFSAKNFVTFSTGCQSTPTHWYQTVLWLEPLNAPTVDPAIEELVGTFDMRRDNVNEREMSFHVKWQVKHIETGEIKMDGSIKSKLKA